MTLLPLQLLFRAGTCNDLIGLKSCYRTLLFEDNMAWGLKQLGTLFIYEQLLQSKPASLLEVGAGRSTFFDQQLGPSTRYYIADEPGYYKAGEFAYFQQRRQHTTHVPTLLGRFHPDLPDGFFEAVVSISVLEHVPVVDIPKVCQDLARIMKPGGWIFHSIDVTGQAQTREIIPLFDRYLREAGFDLPPPPDLAWNVEDGDPVLFEPLRLVYLYYMGKVNDPWNNPKRVTAHAVTYLVAARKK